MTKGCRAAVAAAFLLGAVASAAAPRASIELLPQVAVAGEGVTLGELAHLRSTDLALMRRLVHLPVGRAPQGGRVAVVRQAVLAAWVLRQTGLSQEQLQWAGAAESRVLRAQQRLTGGEIGRNAADALRAWLPSQGTAGDVQLAAIPRDLALPPGEVRLEVRPLGPTQLRGRSVVWVDVWAGEAFVRTLPVTLEVAATGGLSAPLENANLAQVAGPDGHRPPAVARGEWGTLRAVSGAIELESRVEVLQDGQPGQKVRVRQQGATGMVFARVIGRGQLELAP